jgi:hypothetical protein
MNIYVSRDGQTFGPYTSDQAREFLKTGQLLATDFALYEGETEWKTLSSLFDVSDQPIPEPVVEHSPAQVHPSQAQPSATSPVANKKKRVRAKKGAKVKMNKGQSVVVTQEKGLVSRIISTIIVFGVTCVLVCGAVAGLYFAFPSKVSPVLQKFGVSFEEEKITDENTEKAEVQDPANPLDISLNDEDWQRLRSTSVILLATDKGDGFRVISPPDEQQGLNDDDLEALIPISSRIRSLDLTYAEITDLGITTLSKFENLERLYLEGNKKVTVQGINQLKNLKNLTYLNLVRVKLNDELIDLLISMENLREIYLYETGLSEDSISRLTDERPKVFVNGG